MPASVAAQREDRDGRRRAWRVLEQLLDQLVDSAREALERDAPRLAACGLRRQLLPGRVESREGGRRHATPPPLVASRFRTFSQWKTAPYSHADAEQEQLKPVETANPIRSNSCTAPR